MLDRMSMAEPLLPHPESAETALDGNEDAPIPEPHSASVEADDSPVAGRGAPADQVNDVLPMLKAPTDGRFTADDLNGETPD